MPLPGFTKSFGSTKVSTLGEIATIINEQVHDGAQNLAYNIHQALIDETPVDTGTLRWSWRSGVHPQSYIFPRKYSYGTPEVEVRKYKYNFTKFYVWNNTPYLEDVNDGVTETGTKSEKTRGNENFVQRGIAKGLIQGQSFF